MIFYQTDTEGRILHIHHKPFDVKHGLNKTEEELKAIGYLVENLPEPPTAVEGKTLVLWGNPLEWRYYDIAPTKKDTLRKLLEEGKITQEEFFVLLEF